MKLTKLPHEPTAVLEFFQDGLESLGAVCDRTWYDRLHVLAEGRAARLWNDSGDLVEQEIRFPAPDQAAPRQARQEVFPGCPLTFQLAEALNAGGLTLQRVVLQASDKSRAPNPDVAERLWRLQFPGTARWLMDSNFAAHRHFSLVALVRCEIQAIDQHWSLHRLAVSMPEGEPDADLAQHLALHAVTPDPPGVEWPALELTRWQTLLQRALEHDLSADLSGIRQRQENYLRRELDRIDDYFEHYQQELTARLGRSKSADVKAKLEQRRAATRAEHERRRFDQVHRHEIRVIPHLDALLLLAEPAWRVTLRVSHHGDARPREAHWIPRTRRWWVGVE